MNKKIILAISVLIIGLAVGYVVLIGGDKVDNNVATEQSSANSSSAQDIALDEPKEPTNNNSVSADPDTPVSSEASGSYIAYADFNANKTNYSDDKIVYFFNAKWCPTCQALTKDISANAAQIPNGTTIVSVDYDQYTDLKRQYGVTIQHTLVRVDANGNQIKKWSGSPDLSALLSQL